LHAYPVARLSTLAPGTVSYVNYRDEDDWVGVPPEGRYDASRARPEFWRGQRPLSIVAAGIGVALIILLIVVLL
jgi:hypothetical protein